MKMNVKKIQKKSTFKQTHCDMNERRYRDRRVPREVLVFYKDSSFHYMYSSGNNQALLNLSGKNK